MNIDVIFKIAAIGILTAVINQVLKYAGKDEIATLATLAGVIVALFMLINMLMKKIVYGGHSQMNI